MIFTATKLKAERRLQAAFALGIGHRFKQTACGSIAELGSIAESVNNGCISVKNIILIACNSAVCLRFCKFYKKSPAHRGAGKIFGLVC